MIRTLEITVKVGCPLDCCKCPQSKLKAAYSGERSFTVENFAICLSTVPQSVRIDWSGFAEPLIHPDIGQMMYHVMREGREQHLFTTLVGLTYEKLQTIKEVKPSHIRIHCPDQKEMTVPDDQWIGLHEVWCRGEMHCTYMAMGPMTAKVEKYLSELGITVDMPDMLSRGGLLWGNKHLTGNIRCAADRWHQNVLLPNGDVQACCMAYDLSLPVGNLLRQSYSEIEARANEYAANANPPDNSICRDCEWAAPA